MLISLAMKLNGSNLFIILRYSYLLSETIVTSAPWLRQINAQFLDHFTPVDFKIVLSV